jgi:hypothetical protein
MYFFLSAVFFLILIIIIIEWRVSQTIFLLRGVKKQICTNNLCLALICPSLVGFPSSYYFEQKLSCHLLTSFIILRVCMVLNTLQQRQRNEQSHKK